MKYVRRDMIMEFGIFVYIYGLVWSQTAKRSFLISISCPRGASGILHQGKSWDPPWTSRYFLPTGMGTEVSRFLGTRPYKSRLFENIVSTA